MVERKFSEIPCLRSSLLYGITGGIASGLGYFLFTSRVKGASNVAVFSFTGISLSYWIFCRQRWAESRFNMNKIKSAMTEHIETEGSLQDLPSSSSNPAQ